MGKEEAQAKKKGRTKRLRMASIVAAFKAESSITIPPRFAENKLLVVINLNWPEKK
jgi:hypothetical protein